MLIFTTLYEITYNIRRYENAGWLAADHDSRWTGLQLRSRTFATQADLLTEYLYQDYVS